MGGGVAVATVTDSRGRAGVAVATVTDSIAYPNTLLMYYIGNFFPLFFHIYRLWTLDFGLSYPNTLPIPIHCIPGGTGEEG